MRAFFRGITETVPTLFRGIFSERNSVPNPTLDISTFLGPNASLVAISRPNKVEISRAHAPLQMPLERIVPASKPLHIIFGFLEIIRPVVIVLV
jgi:hypothetical protein